MKKNDTQTPSKHTAFVWSCIMNWSLRTYFYIYTNFHKCHNPGSFPRKQDGGTNETEESCRFPPGWTCWGGHWHPVWHEPQVGQELKLTTAQTTNSLRKNNKHQKMLLLLWWKWKLYKFCLSIWYLMRFQYQSTSSANSTRFSSNFSSFCCNSFVVLVVTLAIMICVLVQTVVVCFSRIDHSFGNS